MKKSRRYILMGMLLIYGYGSMSDSAIIPIVAGITETFPDATALQLDWILLYPSVTALIGALLMGVLSRYIKKKTLSIFVYILFIISGCGGALIDEINYIIVMRMIMGFVVGSVPPLMVGLINDCFEDMRTQSFVLGISKTFTLALGTVMSLVAGILAVTNWHNAFYLYLLGIPILVMIIFLVPNTPPEGKKVTEVSTEKRNVLSRIPWFKFAPMILAMLTVCVMVPMFSYYTGIYVEEMNLGDTSIAGIIGAAYQVGIGFAGLLLSKMFMKMKRGIAIVPFSFTTIMFLILAFTNNIYLVCVASVIGGFGLGTASSSYVLRAGEVMPEDAKTLGYGITISVVFLGIFLVSPVRAILQSILQTDMLQSIYPIVAVILAIGTVMAIVLTIRDRRNKAGS